MMGTLGREGYSSERFDRVRDFTKNVAIVPVSAKTGEGLGESPRCTNRSHTAIYAR